MAICSHKAEMEKPADIRPEVSDNPGKDRPFGTLDLNQVLRMEKKSCDFFQILQLHLRNS